MKVIAFPHRAGRGGPATFQKYFVNHITNKLDRVVYFDEDDAGTADLVIVVGGTKKLFYLLYYRLFKRIPVILRLDGINYRHNVYKSDIKNYIKANTTNLLIAFYRRFIANGIIYQSRFASNWWNQKYGETNKRSIIIHNGTIPYYKKETFNKSKHINIICVEGTIPPDDFVDGILKAVANPHNIYQIEIQIIGQVLNDFNHKYGEFSNIKFLGYLSYDEISAKLKEADIFLSLEINPACPNSILEAMAHSLPIIAFNTGAMCELVTPKCGQLVDFMGNSLSLQHKGDYSIFQEAVIKVFNNLSEYSSNAYENVETNFRISNVLEKYYNFCLTL